MHEVDWERSLPFYIRRRKDNVHAQFWARISLTTISLALIDGRI